LRDWVLVLYGTDSYPRKSPTSVRSPKDEYYRNQQPDRSYHYPSNYQPNADPYSQYNPYSSHDSDPYDRNPYQSPNNNPYNTANSPNSPYHNPFARFFSSTLYPSTTSTTTAVPSTAHLYDMRKDLQWQWESSGGGPNTGTQHRHHTVGHHLDADSQEMDEQRKNSWGSATASRFYWENMASAAYARHKHQHSHPAPHTCVYETLAKKSNLSASSSSSSSSSKASLASSSSKASSAFSSFSSASGPPAQLTQRNVKPKLTAGKLCD
jgi:hypothetical protein